MTPLYWLAWSTSRLLFRNLFRCRVYHPERGPLTGQIQDAFFKVIRAEVEDRHGWLTFV